MLPHAAAGQSTSRGKIAGLSLTGLLLFLIGLLVVGSGFTSFRPQIMGLALHPYLVPLAAAVPFVLMSRLGDFPFRVLSAMVVFAGMYAFSVFNGSVAMGEIFKVGSFVVTIVTCALLVRRRGDFVAGALGLSLAVALLASRGLSEEVAATGVDAIQGANKNSYSLFALPAILLAGFICLHFTTTPIIIKAALILCTLPALAAIFMSGNRSGYLGAVVIGGMLFWNRRGRGMVFVAAIAATVAFGIMQFGTTEVLDQRLKQTMEGNKSDDYRLEIFLSSLQVGLENPIIGVSPQQLPYELGRRTSLRHGHGFIDPHNVYGHLLGGSGMICFAAFVTLGVLLWQWKPRDGHRLAKTEPLRDARRLLRMMVVLWAIRGIFTREVLYAPAFGIGLGLSIGLCLLAEAAGQQNWPDKSKPKAAPPPPGPQPALGVLPGPAG
jgi:hypothetical protein